MSNLATLQSTRAVALAIAAMFMSGNNASADQVIPDDLIVQGSTCTGLDCVNNEVFNFDTLKLKENNLRLFFEDTSTSPGFPPNDWRLIANDSASGGSNYFAIQDATAGREVFRVDAGAPANALRVNSFGNVGIGTAAPALDLHIATSNTPTMRYEQTSAGGFTPQTWDVGGNDANFFVRDITGGSRLPLRIRPGAPTSSVDIAATGNVGIGTAAPGSGLTVAIGRLQVTGEGAASTTGAGVEIGNPSGVGVLLSIDRGTGNFRTMRYNSLDHRFETASSEVMRIVGTNVGIGTTAPAARLHTTGSVRFAGVASCSSGIASNASGDLSCLASSRRFKHVTGDLAPSVALANVMALRPQVGAYLATPDVPEHWLIAEDVAAVDPALAGLRDGEPYTVKTQNIVADLIAVVQQQQRRIEALERALAE